MSPENNPAPSGPDGELKTKPPRPMRAEAASFDPVAREIKGQR